MISVPAMARLPYEAARRAWKMNTWWSLSAPVADSSWQS